MSECCGCGASEPEGATASSQVVALAAEHTPWWRDRNLACAIAAGLGWVVGLICEWLGVEAIALSVYALALLSGAMTFVPPTLRKLVRQRGRNRLGVGLLMTIAAIGSVLLGHVGEAAALAFLFAISETLEDKAMRRARRGLHALLNLIPDTARVVRHGEPEEIAVADVVVGDTLVILAGERVPTDGVVVEGASWVDSSAMTGESIPAEITVGDAVLAGAVNGTGVITLRATADGTDNSLTQIVGLVQQAHAVKGQRARLADRIARPLVPLVLVVAAVIAIYGVAIGQADVWIERALVVLVAASPCALAIAVPVTVISAIGAASKLGVVIKTGAAFEELGTVRVVAFDKTGTLTRNRPIVVHVHAYPGYSEEYVCEMAAALERQSQHPLAAAVVAKAAEVSAVTDVTATDVSETPGVGMQGTVGAHRVRVGNVAWLDVPQFDRAALESDFAAPQPEFAGRPSSLADDAKALANQGMSVIAVEVDGDLAGLLGIRDELRVEVPETVAQLRGQGIGCVMITGDREETACVLAEQVGISQVFAGQLPADKARRVVDLCAVQPTAMVGDGTNDAPALAYAHVGIAMGASSSAAAIASADIAFMGHDLRQLPRVFGHARRGRRIMVANICLALAVVIGLFPLALSGVLGLAAVVFIHEVAEVIIIANGMRAAIIAGSATEA